MAPRNYGRVDFKSTEYLNHIYFINSHLLMLYNAIRESERLNG